MSSKAIAEILTGNCLVCDAMFAISVTWFGDPLYEVELGVEHLPDGIHRPHVLSTGRLRSPEVYAEMRRKGWRDPL